jgi:multidrug resistance efflux pump
MKWLVKWGVPAAAALLFAVAIVHVSRSGGEEDGSPPQPLSKPPSAPFEDAVAGAGIIEAQTENIEVGTQVPGVVAEVLVEVADRVAAGDPLFRLDTTEMEAQLQVQQAAVEVAQAELARLEQMPRPEEVPIQEALVQQAEARLEEARSNWQRVERLTAKGAVTEEQVDIAREQLNVSQTELARTRAQMQLLQAGSWAPEKKKAAASLLQAKAELQRMQTEIGRRTVKARIGGEVLQVNVRPGEYVGTPPTQALVVLGETTKLHVRVDIDEADIPRFTPGASGIAMLRGDSAQQFRLTFKRVEPFVVPKRSLTGDNTERIDTRVLQVIYEIVDANVPLYVGQQVDVFIKSDASERGPAEGSQETGG